jgi:hypothetical protein
MRLPVNATRNAGRRRGWAFQFNLDLFWLKDDALEEKCVKIGVM